MVTESAQPILAKPVIAAELGVQYKTFYCTEMTQISCFHVFFLRHYRTFGSWAEYSLSYFRAGMFIVLKRKSENKCCLLVGVHCCLLKHLIAGLECQLCMYIVGEVKVVLSRVSIT